MKLSPTTLAALTAFAVACASARMPAPSPDGSSAPTAAPAGAPSASTAPATASAAAAAPIVHGINPLDMNTVVAVCKDFNEYANGGWRKANPIPSDQSYWGSFTLLEETNRENLHKILEKASKDRSVAAGSDDQRIGDFYGSCMDQAAIDAQGIRPLAAELSRIEKMTNVSDLQSEIAHLQTLGVDALFQFGSEQDRKNSTEVKG